jgi:outer membrane murein-binding lipoprotein Lpp
MHRRTLAIGAVAVAGLVLVAGCGSSGKKTADAGGTTSSGTTLSGTVTVFAASSL